MKQNKLPARFNDTTFRHAFSDLDHKMTQFGECVASHALNMHIEDLDFVVNELTSLIERIESFDLITDENESKD